MIRSTTIARVQDGNLPSEKISSSQGLPLAASVDDEQVPTPNLRDLTDTRSWEILAWLMT
jgi:hypothetical protein